MRQLPGITHEELLQQQPLLEQVVQVASQLTSASVRYPADPCPAAPAGADPAPPTLDAKLKDRHALTIGELSDLARALLR